MCGQASLVSALSRDCQQVAILEYQHGNPERWWFPASWGGGQMAVNSASQWSVKDVVRKTHSAFPVSWGSPPELWGSLQAGVRWSPGTLGGRSIFEGLLDTYPKRTDLWSEPELQAAKGASWGPRTLCTPPRSVYMDAHIKAHTPPKVERSYLECVDPSCGSHPAPRLPQPILVRSGAASHSRSASVAGLGDPRTLPRFAVFWSAAAL